MDASGLGYGAVAGSCEHRNEPSGSVIGLSNAYTVKINLDVIILCLHVVSTT